MDEEAPKDEIEVVIEETPEPEKQAEPEVEAKTEDQAEPEKQEIVEVEAKTEEQAEPEKQEIVEVLEAKTEEIESPEKAEVVKLRAELKGLKIESLIVKNLDKLTPKLQAHVKTLSFEQAESLISVLPSLNQTPTFTAPSEVESNSDLAARAKILSRLTGLNQESLLANLKGKNEQI